MTSEIKLNNYGSLFGANPSKRIVRLPLSELHQHPKLGVEVKEDAYLTELVESIKQNGVIEDVRAFPDPDGGYWIISGRHRCAAARLAGLTEISTIVDDDMTVEQAEIAITDCNLRHELSVMERAWTYRIKREAESRQGHRTDLIGAPDRSEEAESARTVQRYIRLTYLISTLQVRTEETGKLRLPVRTGAALSYLDAELQRKVNNCILVYDMIPDQDMAESWKVLFDRGALDETAIEAGFAESVRHVVKPKPYRLSFDSSKIMSLVPGSYTKQDTEALILTLLEKWNQEQQGARFQDGR